jgi:hypothetical protein
VDRRGLLLRLGATAAGLYIPKRTYFFGPWLPDRPQSAVHDYEPEVPWLSDAEVGRQLTHLMGGLWRVFTMLDVDARADAVVCHHDGLLVEFHVANARNVLRDMRRDSTLVKAYADWVAYGFDQAWLMEQVRAHDSARCRIRRV